MDEDFDLFDLPIVEPDQGIAYVRRQPSTDESRDRYAFLRRKR